MADGYDNGYNSSDFKRNANQNDAHDGEETPKVNEKAGEYMRELLSEKVKIDQAKYPLSTRLIDQGTHHVTTITKLTLRSGGSYS